MDFKIGDKIRLKEYPTATIWKIVDIENLEYINIGNIDNSKMLHLKDEKGKSGITRQPQKFEKINKDNHPYTSIFK